MRGWKGKWKCEGKQVESLLIGGQKSLISKGNICRDAEREKGDLPYQCLGQECYSHGNS